MMNTSFDLARATQEARLAEVQTTRRARQAATVRRLQRRAVRLSQKARRASRRAEQAASRARLAVGRGL